MFVSVSAWKNSINFVLGGIRMLLSSCALKSLNNKIQPRMMCVSFNNNPCTTIISCYSPINASNKIDIITFYNKLSSLVQHILINSGDMNAQIGKGKNNKFCLHNSSNRNGKYLTLFNREQANMP